MKLFKKLSGHKTTVGLDIGNHSIKLVKLLHQKDGYYLEAIGIKDLLPGTIQGREIKKRDLLIAAINDLINQCDPSIVEVVISMAGNGILSDKFIFKIDSNDNAEELILWEAGQRSPFDVDDITLDYKILHRNSENGETEVLLIAAKNQIMQSYIDLLYDTGLRPVVIDVDAFAINNCYSLEASGNSSNNMVALINIGHDLTNITFVKDGIYHSSRDVSTAGDYFLKIIQRNLCINYEDALQVLRGHLPVSIDKALVRQSIEYAVEEISSGIELAFSYLRSSEKNETIDKIVLSGGGAYIPDIVPLLEKRCQIPVQISNPLAYLKYDQGLFGNAAPQSFSALFTVAIGLALRNTYD